MFRFFKQKPDQSQMFADGEWHISKGTHEGSPIIVRSNDVLKQFVARTNHIMKIGFAIPLNIPRPGELPTPDEDRQIADIEDRILKVLQEHGSAVQALAITMGTFKEFVFYATPELDVQAVHEQLMSEIKSHKIQCYAEIEKDWKTYKEFSNG
jgi:hypothetical protein